MIKYLMTDNYVHLYKGITDMKAVWDVERICAIEYDRVRVRNSSYWHAIENVSPIPLTEDILIRCGFEKQNEYDNVCVLKSKDGSLTIGYDTKHKYLEIEINIDYFELRNVHHLHSLQNLVKLLCNQTIELK